MRPVIRSLSILKTLAQRRSGLGLQDLADELDLPISTVHRLAGVLMDEGFLVRVPGTKHFLLGPQVRTLLAGTDSYYIRRVAEPHMRHLNRVTNENVFLAELVGNEVVCFDFMPGIRQLTLYVKVGTVVPLHAGASSRVLLAHLEPQSARDLLEEKPLERLRPNTMTDPDEVMQHLEVVRERGYDVCDDEMEARVFAAAAPIRDGSGDVCASIAVLTPEEGGHPDADYRKMLIDSVSGAAETISIDLGLGAGRQAMLESRTPKG